MGHFQGGVPHLSGLLAEDGPEQSLLRRELCLSLGSYLAHQDISRTDFRSDADDSSLIQILQGVLAYAGHVPGDLLRSQLGIPGFRLILLDVDGSVHILLHQPLAEQYGILVVVALPGHESDQRVLAQGDLSVLGGRTVSDYLAGLHMVSLEHDGLLVVAVGLVAPGELDQMVHISVSIGISLDDDLVGSGALHHAGVLCQHAHAGVHRGLRLDAGSHHRSFRGQKGHCLTLHVGSHQGAVCVVVLQEGDHGRRHREHHLRRNVHQIDVSLREFGSLLAETSGYIVVYKMTFLIQGLVRLRNDIVVLLVGGQVYHLVRDDGVRRVCGLIHHPVGSLDKSVFIYSRIGSQRVDQTDVGTLRSLDGTHTAVVGIVNVPHLKSGAVSG